MFVYDEVQNKAVAGPLDMVTIVLDAKTGRYHPYFYEWSPLPGQFTADIKDLGAVRLRSKMHHTAGFASLPEAQASLRKDVAEKLQIDPANVFLEEDQIRVMDEIDVSIIIVDNWRK